MTDSNRPLRVAVSLLWLACRVALIVDDAQFVTERPFDCLDGTTRTLLRLVQHLRLEGHKALIYAPRGSRPVSGHSFSRSHLLTLLEPSQQVEDSPYGKRPAIYEVPSFKVHFYPDLRLGFATPGLIRSLCRFEPDVIHFVDPTWLCAQVMLALPICLPGVSKVSSYHTCVRLLLQKKGLY